MGQVGTEATLQEILGVTKNIRTFTQIIAKDQTTATWAGIKDLVDGGLAESIYPVGAQIEDTWKQASDTEYAAPWDIAHYNSNGDMYLKWHFATPDTMPFDQPEALYVFDGTEQPGVEYYIEIGASYGTGWVAGAGIAFTLSEAPSEGDQLVISTATNNATDPTGGIAWNVYAAGGTTSKQSGTTSNSTSGTKLGATSSSGAGYTNGSVNAPQRVVYGYNRWSQSAVRQYLNSAAAAGAWWTMQNVWDRPPSVASTLCGFMAGLSSEMRAVIEKAEVVTALNTAEGASSTTETTEDYFWLPSLQEMYVEPQLASVEGEDWDYFKDLAEDAGLGGRFQRSVAYTQLITYNLANNTSPVNVRLRSASRGVASNTWTVYSSGTVNYNVASTAYRGCPACKISKSA